MFQKESSSDFVEHSPAIVLYLRLITRGLGRDNFSCRLMKSKDPLAEHV